MASTSLINPGPADLGSRCERSAGHTYGPATSWRGLSIIDTPRFKELDFKQSYFACIAHGERVVLDTGAEVPIEDVVPGDGVQAIRGWDHQPGAPVAVAVRTGREEVLRLTTRSGRVVRVSDKHPMLAAVDAAFGYVRAGRLQPGDYLGCARKLTTGAGGDWTTLEAKLLGYLVGDGCCSHGHSGFTQKSSSEVAADFERSAAEMGWGIYKSATDRWQMRVKGDGVSRFIARSGLGYKKSRTKHAPTAMFSAAESVIAQFIGALWDCDGSVSDHLPLAILSTVSGRLATDVQSLLLRLGVWAGVRAREQPEYAYGTGLIYSVEVSGEDIRRFAAVVPLVHAAKSRRLAKWGSLGRAKPGTDIIPRAWQAEFAAAVPKGLAPSGNVGRDRLAKLAEQHSDDALYDLATSDVRWDRISSVEREAATWVYDLSVPGPESFVVGGAYVHNCTNHDQKRFDFDGRMIASGGSPLALTQPLLTAQQAPFYVPLRARRPSSPYRLARAVAGAFTGLVFGDERFPGLRVMGDLATDDYAGALVKATNLQVKAVQLRNFGGQCGTAAYSWGVVNGRPRITVLNPKTLYVHSWDDRDELIPRHVTRAYLYGKDQWNPQRKRFERVFYWYRRDWTPEVDIIFKPLLFQNGVDPSPLWEPDLEKSVHHGDGVCHVVWGQNKPADDIDGEADYEGQYENFDELDCMLSVVLRGAKLNLDPTLVLKADRQLIDRMGVRKGSDNALIIDKDGGDAKYLELAGAGLEVGIKIVNEYRKTILESLQCVFPDPDKVAAAATSSVALKMIYKPMLSEGAVIRGQYGPMLARGIEELLVTARRASESTVIVYDEETGAQIEATPQVMLPDKVVQAPKLDGDGNPTGEVDVQKTPRDPGTGEDVDAEWPDWFPPTPADLASAATTTTTAVGVGTAVMSQQTATEYLARQMGKDPAEEWRRVQKQTSDNQAKSDEMFADAGGNQGGKIHQQVEHEQNLPGGGTVKKSQKPKPPPPMLPPALGGKPGKPGAPGAPPGKGGGTGLNDVPGDIPDKE